MKQRTQCKYSALLYTHDLIPRWGQKNLKKVMLHIKLKEKQCRTLCKFDLMHTPDLLGCVKRSDIEIVQILKYILIELSELIFFGYDLSDTQDGPTFWRNGIYILWLTSPPCDKVSGERSKAHGPSCFPNRKTFPEYRNYKLL